MKPDRFTTGSARPLDADPVRVPPGVDLCCGGYSLAAMGYSPGFSGADYDEFKVAFQALGARVGMFDSNQALSAIGERRPTLDADDPKTND